MSVFPIFIKSSSNLLALTFVWVYIEDVKEKNPIPLYIKIKVPTMKSPLNLVKSLLAVAGVAALSAVSAAPASAFSFSNIAGGDTPGDAYENNFTFDVFNQGSSVFFNITNSGNAALLVCLSVKFCLMIMAICLIPRLTLVTLVR